MRKLYLKRINTVIFILIITASLSVSAEYKIAGTEGSLFTIKSLDKWSAQFEINIRSMFTEQGLLFVECESSRHPDQGNIIRLKTEAGVETLTSRTLYPVKDIQVFGEKIYTLEEEIFPSYAIQIARKMEYEAKYNKYKSGPDLIDWTCYYVRCYSYEIPQGKTLIELPKISGFPESGQAPIGFFPTSKAIFLLYLRGNKINDDFLYNLLVVKYPFSQDDSPTTITFPQISCYSEPRAIQLHNDNLYLIRSPGKYDLNLMPEPNEILRLSLVTGEVNTVLRDENIIFFAIDESAREVIYVTFIVHHDRANEFFIKRRSLDNLAGETIKEKLPFTLFYKLNWDANLKELHFFLPPNEPINSPFSKGGWYAVKVSHN